MLELFIKYWVQWLFGIIATGLGIAAKHYHSLYKKNKANMEEKQMEQIHKDMDIKVKESEEHIMEQVEAIRNESLNSSAERYNTILARLSTHETDTIENYESMFSSITKQIENLKAESDAQDHLIKEDLNGVHTGINILQSGILSIQGKDFKNTCRQLLEPDHVITELEYEEITEDHDTYNRLGGNHNGDELFHMVQAKYEKSL